MVMSMTRRVKRRQVPTVMRAVFFRSLYRFCGWRCSPKRNINKIMPRCEICSMSAGFLTIPMPHGPMINPNTMYARIIGCFTYKNIVARIEAPAKIRASLKMMFSKGGICF
jgi:hypothetical protein